MTASRNTREGWYAGRRAGRHVRSRRRHAEPNNAAQEGGRQYLRTALRARSASDRACEALLNKFVAHVYSTGQLPSASGVRTAIHAVIARRGAP